jgi:hypothetical protein
MTTPPLTAPEPPFGLGLRGTCPRACERTLIGLTVAQPSGTLGSATVQCDNFGAAKGKAADVRRRGGEWFEYERQRESSGFS